MSFFDPQNPGIGGLDELTEAEELFITSLAGLTLNQGDILYADAGGILTDLGIGSASQVLTVVGGLPSWEDAAAGYTDEQAQDAVGGMVDTTLVYTDATPLLSRAALTGAITAAGGSNATALGSFTLAQLNTALSDADVATGGGTATGTNTGDQTSIVGITGTKAQFDTAVTDGNFLYVGDITQYTDELAQDAVGNAVGNGLDYDDPSGAISVDETELAHNSLGSKQGGTTNEFYHLTSAQNTFIGAITSSAAELNILDGATLTTTELNFVDGVTSSIQTQFAGKVPYTGATGDVDLGVHGLTLTDLHFDTALAVTSPTLDQITLTGTQALILDIAALSKGNTQSFQDADGIIALVADISLATLGVDADLATFSLPASTTISAFGASIVDDANAAAVLSTLALDADLATFALPASTTISAFGRTIVDDANAAAVLSTLALDADLATFALPASTTISTFGASLIDDAAASNARTTLELVAGGAGDIWVEKAGDTMTGALVIDGSADAIQLRVQGNATQTSDYFVIETSAGADLVWVDDDGFLNVGRANVTESNGPGAGEFTAVFKDGFVAARDGGQCFAQMITYSASAGNASQITTYRAKGSEATPTEVVANDALYKAGCRGYTGSAWTNNRGDIRMFAAEDFSVVGQQGTYMTFHTTPVGSTTLTENVRLLGTGFLGIGNTPATKLDVTSADSVVNTTLRIAATSANVTTADTFIDFRSTDGSIGTVAGTAVAGTIAYNTFTGAHWSQSDSIEKHKVKRVSRQPMQGETDPDEEGETEKFEYFIEKEVDTYASELEPGSVLVSTDEMCEWEGEPNITLPRCEVSTKADDPAVYGVYGGHDIDGDVEVLGLGSGIILVCTEGGDIKVGDFLSSSSVPGHAKRYDGNDMRVVIAKARQGFNGKKPGVIACTLLCG